MRSSPRGDREEDSHNNTLGATPQQVFRSVLAEAVLMALLGTATRLLVGLPLEWYTVRILLFVETGTLLSMLFAWTTVATISILLLLCAVLASIGPALHSGRMRIADALAQE